MGELLSGGACEQSATEPYSLLIELFNNNGGSHCEPPLSIFDYLRITLWQQLLFEVGQELLLGPWKRLGRFLVGSDP